MKRKIGYLVVLLLLAGCRGGKVISEPVSGISEKNGNTDFGNMDFTYTTITEYKPISGEWRLLSYYPEYGKEYVGACLPDVAYMWNETIFDSKKARFDALVWNNAHTDKEYKQYPYDELPDEAQEGVICSVYRDESSFVEIGTGGKIRCTHPAKIRDLLENEELYSNGDMRKNGEEVCTFDLTADTSYADKRYLIGSREESVGDALKRMKAYMYENPLCEYKFDKIDYTIRDVTVLKYGISYGFVFKFDIVYDGIPILNPYNTPGDSPRTAFQREDDKYKYIKAINNEYFCIGTCSEEDCDFIWTTPLTGLEPEIKKLDEILDYEHACKIVSDFLSPSHVFTIGNVTLQYAMVTWSEKGTDFISKLTLEPIWRFTITNLDTAEYSVMYLDISAYNGDIMMEITI